MADVRPARDVQAAARSRYRHRLGEPAMPCGLCGGVLFHKNGCRNEDERLAIDSGTAAKHRAYRYEVIDHGGEGTKAIGNSPTIIDWKYLGKEYIWNIFGDAGFEPLGFITGRYMDKGWLVDGRYASDKEMAANAA